MDVERGKRKGLDPNEVAHMSLPDLWVACMKDSGPIDELMAMRDWSRFVAPKPEDRMKSMRVLWQNPPWGRGTDGVLHIGEGYFFTWFALHDRSIQVRRYCAGLLTMRLGTKISGFRP